MSHRAFTLALLLAFVSMLLVVPALHADDTTPDDPFRQRLEDTPVTLSVTEKSLAEVVQDLREQSGLNLLIDPRVESDIGDLVVRDLHVEDLPAAKALDLLVVYGGSIWTTRGNAAVITFREYARPRLLTRVLPLHALAAPRTRFGPEAHDLFSPDAETAEAWDAWKRADPLYPTGMLDEIIELVKAGVEPRWWEETEGAEIETLGSDRLLVTATPRIHERVLGYLARLEASAAVTVFVRLRAVAADRLRMDDAAPLPADGVLEDAQAERLLADAEGPGLAAAVRAALPSTLLAGGRTAYWSTTNREAPDWVDGDAARQHENHGMSARLIATPVPDAKRVRLDLGVRIREQPTFRPRDDARRPMLAASSTWTCDGTFLLPSGRWVLAEGGAAGGEEAGWALLVRLDVLAPESLQGEASKVVAVETPAPRGRDAFAGREAVDVALEDATYDDVARLLRDLTGLGVFITPHLRAKKFDEISVDLHLEDVRLENLLDLLTEPYGVAWTLENDVIVLADLSERRVEMATRSLDVRDLTTPVFRRERVVPWGVQRLGEALEVGEEREPFRVRELIELILQHVPGREGWEDPAAVDFRNGQLRLINTPDVLDAVGTTLDRLRASLIRSEAVVDILEVPEGVVRNLLGPGGWPATLSREQVEGVEEAIRAGEASRLARERVVSLEAGGALRERIERTDIVVDGITDPEDPPEAVAAVLETGRRLALRVLPALDGERSYVEVAFERRTLANMRQQETAFGLVDLPDVKTLRIHTGLTVDHGVPTVVGAAKEEGRWRVLLVEVRTVP